MKNKPIGLYIAFFILVIDVLQYILTPLVSIDFFNDYIRVTFLSTILLSLIMIPLSFIVHIFTKDIQHIKWILLIYAGILLLALITITQNNSQQSREEALQKMIQQQEFYLKRDKLKRDNFCK